MFGNYYTKACMFTINNILLLTCHSQGVKNSTSFGSRECFHGVLDDGSSSSSTTYGMDEVTDTAARFRKSGRQSGKEIPTAS